MAFINPMDFEQIFVNILSGSPEIFGFLAVIVIASACAFFRMPNYIALTMLILFGVFLNVYLGGLYVVGMILAGTIIFYMIAKIMKT